MFEILKLRLLTTFKALTCEVCDHVSDLASVEDARRMFVASDVICLCEMCVRRVHESVNRACRDAASSGTPQAGTQDKARLHR
jgi:hypothetical protein